LRRFLVRFKIKERESENSGEEEVMVAGPYRILLVIFLVSFFILTLSVPVLCLFFDPAPATLYVLRNTGNSSFFVYITLQVTYVMTDLRKNQKRRFELFAALVPLIYQIPVGDIWIEATT